MRLELPDGQWAELRDHLTYGQAREVRRASLAADEDRMALADYDLALVRAYVAEWNIAGGWTLDQAESVDDAIVQAIAKAALDAWNGKPIPKDETSSSTLRALG